MKERADVPKHIVAKIDALCRELPETRMEVAWTGVRWRVRSKTFAHVLMIHDGWPPVYARAAKDVARPSSATCVMTFRSRGRTFEPAAFARPPFFRMLWPPDIVGLRLDGRTNWREVRDLVAVSYAVLAPLKLASLTERKQGNLRAT
jgi:predicted DNA-binding protein (MmcQ/YjbR family)